MFSDALALFVTPNYAPFAISFVIMIGVGVIEAIGLGIGQFDADAGFDSDIGGATVLAWLGLGSGLPILIWLTSLLGCFTLTGLAIQQIAGAVFGAPLHWAIATACAFVTGGAMNRVASSGLARIMPGYESTVISAEDLVMRRGTILEGNARRGHPARARVVDQHNQAHYVMVEPHHDSDHLMQGETGLLVRRSGAVFFAIPDAPTGLRALD